MTPGELHIAKFPYGGKGGYKMRPVLLLTGLVGPVPEVLTAYLSSAIPTPLLASDVVIDPTRAEHAGTNLTLTSVIRLHKLSTVHLRDVVRQVGRVSAVTWQEVQDRLRVLLNL